MLEVVDLNAGYGDAQVLWDISLSVGTGEIVTVVGSNGAGKTSLVNAIVGMLKNRWGYVGLDGEDIVGLPQHEIANRGAAIVPEGRRLFSDMSVIDNLYIGSYRREARPHHDETLEQVFELFPILKSRRNQLAGTLSGGEQQMLSISRALMARPRMLLLDEPSLGLAPLIVDNIFETLQEINEAGVTILLVEQNVVKAFELASRGYILEVGHIVTEGQSKELVADEQVREAYLGL